MKINIKKIFKYTPLIVIFCLAIFIVFVPENVQAISGACSWHGGVDCSAGVDWDGSVICNDGWRNSSVSYYSTIECQTQQNSCPVPYGHGDLSICAQYQTICDQVNASRYQTCTRNGIPLDSSNCVSVACTEADSCKKQVADYNAWVQEYNKCIETEHVLLLDNICSGSDINSSYDSNLKKCICNNGYQIFNGKCTANVLVCYSKYGSSAISNGDSCACKDGYLFSVVSSQCVSYRQYCFETLGSYSHVRINEDLDYRITTDHCRCNEGYEIKSSKCVEQEWRRISVNAKEWADSYSGSCKNATNLSEEETKECIDYQLHKHLYNWEVYNPNQKISSPKSEIISQPKLEIKSVSTTQKSNIVEKELPIQIIKKIGSEESEPPVTIIQTSQENIKIKQVIINISRKVGEFFKNIFDKIF